MLMRSAAYSPIVTVGIMGGAVAAIHVGAARPLSGFGVFVLTWALGGLLSIALGLLAWRRARKDSRSPAAGLHIDYNNKLPRAQWRLSSGARVLVQPPLHSLQLYVR